MGTVTKTTAAQDNATGADLLVERRGATVILTLNDPAHLNPLSLARRVRLIAEINLAYGDKSVRSIVITGAGGQFSAGADIREMNQQEGPDPEQSRQRLENLHACVRLVAAGPKPVLAAVEGAAFGAGLSLALACDFVVATPASRFGAAFGRIGLAPDMGLMWSLPQRIGVRASRDFLFTGRAVRGEEAERMGLADLLVPEGGALDAAVEKAASYHNTAPLSLAAMKTGFAEGPLSLEAALHLERFQQPLLRTTADHAEGRLAFKEKRAPNFEGR